MKASIQQAIDSLKFANRDLREALKDAGRMEGLMLLPLIRRTAELTIEVDALCKAQSEDMAAV